MAGLSFEDQNAEAPLAERVSSRVVVQMDELGVWGSNSGGRSQDSLGVRDTR